MSGEAKWRDKTRGKTVRVEVCRWCVWEVRSTREREAGEGEVKLG